MSKKKKKTPRKRKERRPRPLAGRPSSPPSLAGADRHTPVLDYYREFLALGDDARRVSWRTRHDQELRFESLLEAVDEEDDALSVLDIGCGLGDLYRYMRATGRRGDYLGIDVVPEMVELARQRHPDARFACLDILIEPPEGRFDLVLCSGGLSVRTAGHESFVMEMIAAMLGLATRAVALNFQSTRAYSVNPLARANDDLFHADPVELYRKCRALCPDAILREDILPTDFAIYLYPAYARSIRRYGRKATPPPSPFGLAFLLLERRLPSAALEVIEAAEPSAELLNLAGVAQRQLGNRRRAATLFRSALELDSAYEPAQLNLQGCEG